MKISVDRASAGFAPEQNEKPGKASQTAKPGSNKAALPAGMKDALELTNTKTAVLNAVREANIDSAAAEDTGAARMNAIKEKLAALNNYIQDNQLEALAAQANLNSETVAKLVG